MTAPVQTQHTQTIYYLPPVRRTKKTPAPQSRPAASYAFLFVVLVFLSICIWQTLQIRQLADYTHALREETAIVQLEQARVLADIRAQS